MANEPWHHSHIFQTLNAELRFAVQTKLAALYGFSAQQQKHDWPTGVPTSRVRVERLYAQNRASHCVLSCATRICARNSDEAYDAASSTESTPLPTLPLTYFSETLLYIVINVRAGGPPQSFHFAPFICTPHISKNTGFMLKVYANTAMTLKAVVLYSQSTHLKCLCSK